MENCRNNIELDLSCMNIFDSLKVMVLSSAKYPETKVRCKGVTDDTKRLLAAFETRNLEFV